MAKLAMAESIYLNMNPKKKNMHKIKTLKEEIEAYR